MSDAVQLTIGMFEFEVGKTEYNKVFFDKAYKWSEVSTINQEFDTFQYGGEKSEKVEIDGVVFTANTGYKGLNIRTALQKEASKGRPLNIFDSEGNSLGQWIILRITAGNTLNTKEGYPRKIEYKMELRQWGGDTWKHL